MFSAVMASLSSIGRVLAALVLVTSGLQAQGTPTVTIAGDRTAVSEGNAAAFTLTRTAPYTDALTVNVSVSQTGEFIETENSYQPPMEVIFNATEAMATLSVETDDDTVDEDNGSVIVTLQTGTGYTLGTTETRDATVEVRDNDQPPMTISLQAPTEVNEDADDETITVMAATEGTRAPTVTIEVRIWLVAGTAEERVDFDRFTKALQFAPGDFSLNGSRYVATKENTITILDDEEEEEEETFGVTMALTRSRYEEFVTLSPTYPAQHLITILANDGATAPPANGAPVFTEGGSASRDVAENTAAGTNIGDPVAATAPDSDTLTYSLSGTDAASFDIVGTSGQLQTKAALDYEAKSRHTVTVSVTNGTARDAIKVTINVTDANDAPAFDPATYAFTLEEGVTAPPPLGVVTAFDPDGDPLAYALSEGAGDPARFAVDATSGSVTYSGPGEDFEAGPTRYALTVAVSDPGGAAATAAVTVTVVNVDEPGTVTLASLAPLVGHALLAELADLDGDVTAVVWSWEWATAADDFVAIPGATGSSYTPTVDAVGRRLRAVARYTDAQGGGKRSLSEATAPVRLDPAERAMAVKASLASFGRTVATATVEAVEDRFESTGAAARRWRASVGGLAVDQPVGAGGGLAGALTSLSSLLGVEIPVAASEPGGRYGPGGGARLDGGVGSVGPGVSALPTLRRRMLRDRLARSAFELGLGRQPDGEAPSGPPSGLTVWGRGDISQFAGRPDDGLALDGDTVTALVGGDYRWSPRGLAGVAVARSSSTIRYASSRAGDGSIDARVITLQPYVYLSPRPNLGVWGLAGVGWGGLDLADLESQGDTTLDADLSLRIAAAGVRQALASTGRVDWAMKADGVVVGLTTAAVEGLPAVEAASARLRAAVEGRVEMAVRPSLRVSPSVEVGARYDGGDADTGSGLEVGGGLAVEHLPTGLSLSAQGRYLVTHHAEAFEEWGAGLTLRVDRGQAGRGLALTLAPMWGETVSGGVQALWLDQRQLARQTGAVGRPPGGLTLRQEVSYGLGLGGQGLITPLAGVDLDAWGGRRLQVGARLAVNWAGAAANGGGLQLEVLGEQTTRQTLPPDYRLGLFGTLRFGAGEN